MTVQFLQLVWSHWHGSRVTHKPVTHPWQLSTEGEMDLAASGDADGVGREDQKMKLKMRKDKQM